METQNQGQGHMSFSLRDIDREALAHARELVGSYPRLQDEGGGGSGDSGGTAPASEGTQSTDTGGSEPAPTPESGGQGFYQEYVESVPEEHREVVTDVLEQYRQEQDANFNKKFQNLREETEIPVTLYNALMSDPVSTLQWVVERFQEEQGRDLRSELLDTWEVNPQSGQEVEPQSGQEDEPEYMTPEQLEKWYEDRREQERKEAEQQQRQQQTVQQREKTVNSWIDEAAESFNLELDDSNGEDPLRAAIVMQANELHEAGKARGKAAIEMVVEQFSKRFQSAASGEGNQGKGEQPVTANGGGPPPSKDIDVSDKNQRRGRMLELFPGS